MTDSLSCIKCGMARPEVAFYSSKTNKSGFRHTCVECTRAQNAGYRAAHRDKVLRQKRKTYHEKLKHDPDYISRSRVYAASRKDAKRDYDKSYRSRQTPESKREKSRAWVEANPELRKAISLNHKSRRRAQENGGCTAQELKKWVEAQEKRCIWCWGDCRAAFHVDHVTPLALGGKHELWNLAIACPQCNLRKSAKPLDDFLDEIGT